jgi:hypothetical protein
MTKKKSFFSNLPILWTLNISMYFEICQMIYIFSNLTIKYGNYILPSDNLNEINYTQKWNDWRNFISLIFQISRNTEDGDTFMVSHFIFLSWTVLILTQEIPTSYVVIFLIVNEVRGDCSVCWYRGELFTISV